jgi:ABC-2 type transport system permease protein
MTNAFASANPAALRADANGVTAADLKLLAAQVVEEQRSFWRNRTRAVFSFVMPVAFLVLLGAANHNAHIGRHERYVAFLVPGMLAWGVISTTFSNLAVSGAVLRDSGVLKRLRGTPLPQWIWLAARLLSSVISAAAMVAVVLIVGRVAYGVTVPVHTVGNLVAAIAAGTVCFSALGMGIVRIIPNADAAPAVTAGVTLPLLFISGVFNPTTGLPAWLDHLAKFFPIRPLTELVHLGFGTHIPAGSSLGGDYLTLAIWTFVGVRMLRRFLRRETVAA